MKDLTKILNKDFTSPADKEVFSVHSVFEGAYPEYWNLQKFGEPFAGDSNGNLFTENKEKKICFWDHETDEVTILAKDFDEFVKGCAEPKEIEVELKEEQVISSWVDPEFAKQMGIEVPKDGWRKRKS